MQNCSRKRTSLVYSSRMSSTPWRISARRSMPKPKAKPDHSSGSSPRRANTLGCTMPQPPSSSQPVWPQVRQPAPSQKMQLMSYSADGSVNGKYDGRRREWIGAAEVGGGERLEGAGQVGEGDAPVDDQALDLVEHRHVAGVGGVAPVHPARHDRVDRRLAAPASPGSAPARCGCAAASTRARRGRRRACPTCPGPGAPAGMLSASKLYQSVSTSGPSATVKPMPTNTSSRRSRVWVTRCRWPRRRRRR